VSDFLVGRGKSSYASGESAQIPGLELVHNPEGWWRGVILLFFITLKPSVE